MHFIGWEDFGAVVFLFTTPPHGQPHTMFGGFVSISKGCMLLCNYAVRNIFKLPSECGYWLWDTTPPFDTAPVTTILITIMKRRDRSTVDKVVPVHPLPHHMHPPPPPPKKKEKKKNTTLFWGWGRLGRWRAMKMKWNLQGSWWRSWLAQCRVAEGFQKPCQCNWCLPHGPRETEPSPKQAKEAELWMSGNITTDTWTHCISTNNPPKE